MHLSLNLTFRTYSFFIVHNTSYKPISRSEKLPKTCGFASQQSINSTLCWPLDLYFSCSTDMIFLFFYSFIYFTTAHQIVCKAERNHTNKSFTCKLYNWKLNRTKKTSQDHPNKPKIECSSQVPSLERATPASTQETRRF